MGRSTCAAFARGILTIQQEIRSRHSVVDRLWTNISQSYVAAVVLCEHLIADPDAFERSLFLELINEAVSALLQVATEDPMALSCARIVQALLQHIRDHQRGLSASPLEQLAHTLAETTPQYEMKTFEQPAFTPNALDLSFKFPDTPPDSDAMAFEFDDTWPTVHAQSALPAVDASLDKTWRWFLDQGLLCV